MIDFSRLKLSRFFLRFEVNFPENFCYKQWDCFEATCTQHGKNKLNYIIVYYLTSFVLLRQTRSENLGKKKEKKSFAMREIFDNTASRIPGIHREVLCVSGDVYEANVCRSGQNNCNPIPLLDLSRLETFTMPQV